MIEDDLKAAHDRGECDEVCPYCYNLWRKDLYANRRYWAAIDAAAIAVVALSAVIALYMHYH